MATNLEAPILLARAFAAALPRRGPAGAVINLLDNKVVSTNPDFFSYTISKQALFGATQTLALALAPRVRVNGIAPGITLISGKQSTAGFARAHDANPLRRGCTPEDVARAALFLLDTPSITGQTLVIDGGASLARPPRDVAFL
jgi:NAD(P)-dependent dehydrogenase (short-subunit alcohol dehydrogenase family)